MEQGDPQPFLMHHSRAALHKNALLTCQVRQMLQVSVVASFSGGSKNFRPENFAVFAIVQCNASKRPKFAFRFRMF
jgi:hypothetical protein